MKKSPGVFSLAFFLLLISAVCASLVAGAYSTTAPIIAQMEEDALKASYREIYPDFDAVVPIGNKGEPSYIKDILLAEKDGKPSGVIYNVVSSGYAGQIEILLAFDIKSQKLTGVKIMKQAETPGLGANAVKPKFTGQFAQKDAKAELTVVKSKPQAASQIEAITASTITSKAVVTGVNAAREHFLANYIKKSGA